MRYGGLVFVLVVLAAYAHAQAVDEPFERLVSARTLRCVMDRGTQASWDAGNLKLEPADYGPGGNYVFDSVDIKQGKARVIGSSAAADVRVQATKAGLTFTEETPTGGLYITTVFAKYDSPESRRFIAVESQHVLVPDIPFPAQFHGTCIPLE